MNTISLKKLSEQTKIDFYQLEKYMHYLGKELVIENNVRKVNLDDLDLITKFINTYTTNEIQYIMNHNIEPFFNGTLMLNLRKKYNLNDKQFTTKISHIPLDYKYVYSDEECKKFDDFMNNSTKNKAELRDLSYVNDGWIPLRQVLDDFGKKYKFATNTGKAIIHSLSIEVYKPNPNQSFLNKEQMILLENFLKQFKTAKERRLYFQEKTCMEKYGVENPTLTDNARQKISEKVKISCTDERQRKIEETKLKKYGKRSITDSEKSMKSRLENYGSLIVNYKYEYDNLEFHSSWELYYYIYQKEILGNIITRGKIFEYTFNDKKHKYECDFEVNGKNIEIKGNQYLDENNNLYFPYINQTKINSKEKQELWNAKQKCMEENNVKIISKEEMKPIINFVDEKYTSDYVNLFKKDLPFPYPNEDFRNGGDMGIIRHFHKSIYHARRGKELSPYEAWQDKTLVKKCALNRLKYVGSCRPNDIIQGFNVAKIAPKVSVFDSKLAEELINKYLSDVRCIVDPFSGFSGRMIGAFRCDKIYYGKDINKTHVQESNEIISYLKGESFLEVQQEDIFNANVRDFLGLKNKHALFTCSPYEDKESWNENDKNLTCDEWIDVCMEKYKLHKYLFVVDNTEKYKDCIVETLENKSHFGKNNEYVILIEK